MNIFLLDWHFAVKWQVVEVFCDEVKVHFK